MPDLYPAVNFAFVVSIGSFGDADASFAEVSGLDVERQLDEIIEGGENAFVHQVPGRLKHGNLVLKRGIASTGSPLFQWCTEALESDLGTPIKPRAIVVSLLNASGAPLISWSVASAWPVKWAVAAFNASDGAVAMETLEFAYATVTRTYGGPS